MHPFDIKTVLFAKHAQHVVLIHFPIALFIIGVFFDFLAQWKKQRLLAAVAYYNLLVAAISTVPVVVTGILVWQWELAGSSAVAGEGAEQARTVTRHKCRVRLKVFGSKRMRL